MNEQIIYYQKRAEEYELVYQKQERQEDLARIKDYLSQQFNTKSILEIACGTGYWTEILSANAKSIFAIDINPEVVQIARNKNYVKKNVTFKVMDMNDINKLSMKFDGLFGGFIWSHILKENIDLFLKRMITYVKPGSEIIFLDNKYVPGSSTPISRTDQDGNTFQKRELRSGEQFDVLKNFPDHSEVCERIEKIGLDIDWVELNYYWMVKFKKKI